MSSKNDITGDRMTSKPSSEAYRNSPFWDNIAKNKKQDESKDKESHPDKDGSPVLSEN